MKDKIIQITTVNKDILVCLLENGDIYSTKLSGKDKGRWTAIILPKKDNSDR